MSDLLDLLGDEWAAPVEDEAPTGRWSCSHKGERENVTHGCRESGRVPTKWSEALLAYVDGMGRITTCGYCHSCIGSGRTSVRDPWTDELLDWKGAPCRSCAGTGWTEHAWDCGLDDWHERTGWTIKEPAPATVWGVTFDGRTVLPNHENRSK